MYALILVDIQKDFLPGGSLAVPEGDAVVPVANRLIERFDLVIASQDWHPPGHGSFASAHAGHSVGDVIQLRGLEQILWPDHCVQDTEGAAFADDLHVDRVDHVVRKGTDPATDSYSAFFDNGHRNDTGLHEYLQSKGVDAVYLVGLALDVCVKYTAIDARKLGYATTVVRDGTRAVDMQPGDAEKAVEVMRDAGVRFVEEKDVIDEVGGTS